MLKLPFLQNLSISLPVVANQARDRPPSPLLCFDRQLVGGSVTNQPGHRTPSQTLSQTMSLTMHATRIMALRSEENQKQLSKLTVHRERKHRTCSFDFRHLLINIVASWSNTCPCQKTEGIGYSDQASNARSCATQAYNATAYQMYACLGIRQSHYFPLLRRANS